MLRYQRFVMNADISKICRFFILGENSYFSKHFLQHKSQTFIISDNHILSIKICNKNDVNEFRPLKSRFINVMTHEG